MHILARIAMLTDRAGANVAIYAILAKKYELSLLPIDGRLPLDGRDDVDRSLFAVVYDNDNDHMYDRYDICFCSIVYYIMMNI